MTDDKQKVKADFKAIVKDEMDKLFAVPLSPKQVDDAIVGEIGTVLEEATIMNNLTTEAMTRDVETMGDLKILEKEVTDLKRLEELRADLDKAA